jgi:hypothetical protein
MVDGLIKGLVNAWPNIISNFEGLINTLISAVKNILGIHSPSTVFAGIGGNVASGFGNGFEGIWGGIQANIVSKIQSLVAKAKQAAAEIQEALQEANAEVGNVLADNGTVNSSLEASQARGKVGAAAGTTNNYYINSSKQTATEIVKETKYINNRAVMTQ